MDEMLGGLKGVPTMMTCTSEVDPWEGVLYRGSPVKTLLANGVPSTSNTFLHLLLGANPDLQTCQQLDAELEERRTKIPEQAKSVQNQLSKDLLPIVKVTIGLLACQNHSTMHEAYWNGSSTARQLWPYALDDALNILAWLPELTKTIIGNSQDHEGTKLVRFLYADHEGGNVSAHATHLVGTTLVDPFRCMASGLAGLAGPLHGQAVGEGAAWILNLAKNLGMNASDSEIAEYAEDTLSKGHVIPGFGHAVLKTVDPRYTILSDWTEHNLPSDALSALTRRSVPIVTKSLKATEKVRNPHPNGDLMAGVLLHTIGLTNFDEQTLVIALGRSIGWLASLVISRHANLPLYYPSSSTIEALERLAA